MLFRSMVLARCSVGVGAQELGAQDGFVEAHAAVELECDIGSRRHGDDDVDSLGSLENVVSKTTFAPDVDLLDGAA